MRTTPITNDITLYTFEPDRGVFATRIVGIRHGAEALLIDAGYERHATAVRAAIDASATITRVVLSHEHEDHAFGCRELPKTRISGGRGFPAEALPERDVEEIGDGTTMEFGAHRLRFRLTPGHSDCHLATIIDDDIVHAGDLLVFTGDDVPTPPFLSSGDSLTAHIESLEVIRELAPRRLLSGHGPVLETAEVIEREIGQRLHYLRHIASLEEPLPLEACLPPGARTWNRPDFHKRNLELLGMTD